MIKFYVKAKKENKKVLKMTRQWEERLDAVVNALPQRVAEQLREGVAKGAPKDLPKYPDVLEAVRFPMQGDWVVAGVIPPGWCYNQRLKSSDAQRTILDVFPEVVAGKVVSEAAVVLQRNNPWTMNTLPYEPTKREALVRSRRVSEKDAKSIEQMREKDRAAITAELRGLGVPIRATGKVLLERRVSRDIAFEVLRREKGIGMPGKAHWRPAVRAIFTQHLKKTMKELGAWMSDPDNAEWKQRSDLPVEAASVIERVQAFQDRIAPGGGE